MSGESLGSGEIPGPGNSQPHNESMDSQNWDNFLNFVQNQSPLPFDENTQDINDLRYEDLLKLFLHVDPYNPRTG